VRARGHGVPASWRTPLIAAGIVGGFAVFTANPAAAGSRWLSFGVLAGTTRPDPDLAGYGWEVGGHASWGLRAMAGSGRVGAGLRFTRWQTRQETGASDPQDNPVVRMSDVRFLVRARAVSVQNLDVYGTAGAGRYRMSYSPDRLTVYPGGGAEPVSVAFAPVSDWSFSLGLGLEHPLVRGLTAGAEIERSVFLLDTAHRSGTQIVTSRDSFRNWNLRLSLSWMLRKP
jgi:hypothetical protein